MSDTSSSDEFEALVPLSQERIEKVTKSDLFLRLVVGNQQEKSSLWIHLRDISKLGGDPSDWTMHTKLNEKQWFMSDGEYSIRLSNRFGRVFLDEQREGVRKLLLKFFIFFTYSVTVIENEGIEDESRGTQILIRKSENFDRKIHAAIQVISSRHDESNVKLSVKISGPNSSEFDAKMLARMLIEICETVDLTPRRELFAKLQIEEAEKKAREDLKARQESLQREKEQLRANRLDRDLCLDCGEAVVQRRNKRDGHLFFGCSQFVLRRCSGAREITCPDCGSSMIERNSRSGGTFLGCSRWPQCRGSRSVTSSIERWSNSGAVDSSTSLDELAQDWGWPSWRHFDEHRE